MTRRAMVAAFGAGLVAAAVVPAALTVGGCVIVPDPASGHPYMDLSDTDLSRLNLKYANLLGAKPPRG